MINVYLGKKGNYNSNDLSRRCRGIVDIVMSFGYSLIYFSFCDNFKRRFFYVVVRFKKLRYVGVKVFVLDSSC